MWLDHVVAQRAAVLECQLFRRDTYYRHGSGSEEVGHASCHVISLAYARSLDSATFIHQDSLLATFVLWST